MRVLRVAVAGLTSELIPGARPTHSGFMTIAQLCDHLGAQKARETFPFRALDGFNEVRLSALESWRFYSYGLAYGAPSRDETA